MLKRLTVHLDKVKKVRQDNKPVLVNTVSVHNLRSESDIQSALTNIRKNYKIAKCTKPDHKVWKIGDEMWYTSNETL